ncbi:hypothetical protein PF010_g20870 [Phytophthora fragariae]|uniref:Transposase Tc1-like domain-containing protein n=1 Tax=Phytophthora fragariae TaxID=53985 RepID=A0A6G0KDH5_9STRA|nr:hypothetical protein PF010_g20870 [Phytophthora fragariae]
MSSSPSARASATPPRRTATEEERQRVLDAFEAGGDWLMVARYNNVSRAAAYRLCKKGDPSPPPRGGARASCVKCTDAMVEALETYLDEECTLTLVQLRDKLMEDFEVDVSTSTISAKLATKLITLKQIRKEPSTCNNDVNKAKRYTFAAKIIRHQVNGDYIVRKSSVRAMTYRTSSVVYWRPKSLPCGLDTDSSAESGARSFFFFFLDD